MELSGRNRFAVKFAGRLFGALPAAGPCAPGHERYHHNNGKDPPKKPVADELIEFGKRWQAAQMLSKNISYEKIEKETGLSSRTVARISKWLNRGMGGYRLMLNKVNHHDNLSPSVKRLR